MRFERVMTVIWRIGTLILVFSFIELFWGLPDLDWVTLAILALAALLLVALWHYLDSHPLGKNQTRYDFQHHIRGLLVLKRNGGYLEIRHRGSSRTLFVVREDGEDAAAVRIEMFADPDLPSCRREIASALEGHGYRTLAAVGPMSLPPVVIQVPDIWAPDAGAAPARALHLILDCWGVGTEARFDCRQQGAASLRGASRLRSGREI